MKHFCLSLIAALLVAAAPPPAPRAAFAPESAGTRLVYRHANLIDGTGGPLRRDMAVVVDGETIVAVVPDKALTSAQVVGAEIVDVTGRYLLPGLIDSHQHLATPPRRRTAEAWLRRDLYSGITAIRDMADDLREVGDLARAARIGEIEAPDIYYAALMAGPSFFDDPRTQAAALGAVAGKVPWMQAIDDRTDLQSAVTMARGTSAIAIKIYANLPARLVAAITREAHRQGMQVWAHGMVFPASPAEVAAAGVDVMSHVCYLAYQASERRPARYQDRFPVDYAKFRGGDNPVMASLFGEMKRRGIILDATLRVYSAAEAAARPGGKPYHCTAELAQRLTNQAWRAGVTISAGTDGHSPASAPYPALNDEIELLVQKAGMPAAEAIRSATLVGAMTMKQDKVMGSIAAGKLANMVIVEENPLEDIRNLRTVLMTVKRGHRFPRPMWRPITREEASDED
jgi:imidazolonepropionase-like amidohydrolase